MAFFAVRASIFFANMMDCRVKPGNDQAAEAHSLSTVIARAPLPASC
jgi:hypothetical protein